MIFGKIAINPDEGPYPKFWKKLTYLRPYVSILKSFKRFSSYLISKPSVSKCQQKRHITLHLGSGKIRFLLFVLPVFTLRTADVRLSCICYAWLVRMTSWLSTRASVCSISLELFYFSKSSISLDFIFPFQTWRNRAFGEIEHLEKQILPVTLPLVTRSAQSPLSTSL